MDRINTFPNLTRWQACKSEILPLKPCLFFFKPSSHSPPLQGKPFSLRNHGQFPGDSTMETQVTKWDQARGAQGGKGGDAGKGSFTFWKAWQCLHHSPVLSHFTSVFILYLPATVCVYVNSLHACLSGSGLAHSGWSFLVPPICLQTVVMSSNS